MRHMRKLLIRGAVLAALALLALGVPSTAKADWVYPTPAYTYMWWTPSQPLAGQNCEFIYQGRGRACSGWNLFYNAGGYFTGLDNGGFTCPGNGHMYTAFQNTSAIRGSIWLNYHSPCNYWETYIGAFIYPWQYFASCGSPCYIKASQYYWDGGSTVARVSAGT